MQKLLENIVATAEIMGREISPASALMMAKDLAQYPIDVTITAIANLRRDAKARFSVGAIIEQIEKLNPDGRPTPDEAWAMMPRSESESVVMSEEMAEADRYAQPLLDCRDQVGARRAFIDAYSRIVEKNKLAGIKPKWFPSLGDDPGGRMPAIAEAVRLGRISTQHGINLTAPEKVPAMLRLAGHGEQAKQFDPATDERAKENRLRIREMTKALTQKTGTGDRLPWEEAE